MNKTISYLLVITALSFSTQAIAETSSTNNPNSIDEIDAENQVKVNIIDNQDMGVFILSKVVDAVTGRPVADVEVSSPLGKTRTDAEGEFLLRVNPNDYIVVNKENYQEASIKVSALRGKISLKLIPKYLPIFPNISASINYRNLGFSEKFNDISAAGRVNDSFSIEASGKLLNFIHLNLNYENFGGILSRSQTAEKTSFTNNQVSLKAAYLLSLLPDTLEGSAGIRGFWNNTSITNPTPLEELDRDQDYLDFGRQRLGVGVEVELGARPIRYVPLVLNTFITYYPLINMSQTGGITTSGFPTSLNGIDYGIGARYDMFGAFIQARFFGKSTFQTNYNSGMTGFSLGLGYGF